MDQRFQRFAGVPRRRQVSIVAFTWAAVLASCLLPATAASAEWRRLDSPHFVVIGDVGAGTLRDIAVKFEGFRETLSRVLSDRVTATAVPTVVVVFPSDRAFTPFKPTFQGKAVELTGMFLGRRDVNYIALVPGVGDDGMRIIFHEYAHLIISNVARNVPAWLNEGLAEYYSTYQVARGGREALLGRPISSHLQLLRDTRLLGLEELIGVTHDSPLYNEGERRTVFYAQSWALTHMLLVGQSRRGPLLQQYLIKLGRGTTASDAWREVFGADKVYDDLRDYIERHTYAAVRYKFADKLTAFTAEAHAISNADADAFLADFLLQQGRKEEATERLAMAARSGGSAWVNTAAALVEAANGGDGGARDKLKSLDGITDWLTAYRAGAVLSSLAGDGGSPPKGDVIAAARRLFGVMRDSSREIPNATARLTELELAASGSPSPDTVAAMDRARLMAPGRHDYVFLHARLLARASSFAAARNVLAPLMSGAYPPEVRDNARTLMGYIVQVERAASSRSAAAAAPAPDTTAPSPDSSSAAPTVPSPDAERFQPLYRVVESGEVRVEGVLQRIDCNGESVVMTLHTSEGQSTFSAAGLDKVDFITYRNDLTGAITCGPLKDPARVYLTWKMSAGRQAVVAIEFLPR